MTEPLARLGDAEALSPVKRAIAEIRDLRARLHAVEAAAREPIAIIGVGCRFPGADGPDSFWQLLRDGVDAIREVPPDRWDVEAYYDPDPDAPGKMYTRHGGFLDHVDGFDAALFGISPREATSLDPQQRLLLEVTLEALEHAAIAPEAIAGSAAGVFVGMAAAEYASLHVTGSATAINAYFGTGNALSVAAGRLSYHFGLQGPCMSVDTACSSSLVTVHLAAQSLRAGECRVALAGGVNLMLRPESTVNFCRARMLAADGRCKTFDAAADGYSRGEGAGMVVLKRLSHAIEDGNRILAVVLSSAVNQDGRSSGLTAPNGPSQEALLRDAVRRAGVSPADVEYVEAHGTGTSLGDPIELHALASVLGQGRGIGQPLVVGSVKTNIGHLEAAAGVAGLVKVVLALQHGEIPPHLHFDRLNPHIDAGDCPIVIPTARRPWPRTSVRRVAGVSAFGFSGTNAHLVVAEAPEAERPAGVAAESERPEVVLLSARTPSALRTLAGRVSTAARSAALADIAFTGAVGRTHRTCRAAIVATDTAELTAELEAIREGRVSIPEPLASPDPCDVAWLFPAAAPPPPRALAALSRMGPAFTDSFERCAAMLDSARGTGWRRWLENGSSVSESGGDGLREAAFALQYAHAALWTSWGLVPVAVGGVEIGELVACAVAEICPLEDVVRLLDAERRGGTPSVRPGQERLLAIAAADGEPLTADRVTRGYFARSAAPGDRDRIRRGLSQHGAAVTISLGVAGETPEQGVIAWAHDAEVERAVATMQARAFEQGVALDWRATRRGRPGTPIALPTYPFERVRYWVADEVSAPKRSPSPAAFDHVADAARRQSGFVPADVSLSATAALSSDIEAITTSVILDVFRSIGAFADGRRVTPAGVVERHRIEPKYLPTIERWLHRLAGSGVLSAGPDGFEAAGPLPDHGTRRLLDEARRRHGTSGGVLDLIDRAQERAERVLRGRESAVETLFPGGSWAIAEEIYAQSPAARYAHAIVAAALRARLASGDPSVVLRVLEIGGGIGGATRALVPEIPPGRGVYYFTDLVPTFVARAGERHGDDPAFRRGLLDITSDPVAQGFPAGAFDMIVASNALTGTSDLVAALDHVFALAAPDALVVIVEPATHPEWFDLILLDEWQRVGDGLREDGPVPTAAKWREALLARGATAVQVLPGDDAPASTLNQAVIVAHVAGAARIAQDAAFSALDSKLQGAGEDAVAAVRVRAQLADALPSEREDLLVEIVRGHVQAVLRLADPGAVDRRHRLVDLGVDSLMAVELRNRLESALDLKNRLPATLVFDFPSIDAIARHLDEVVAPSTAAGPRPASSADTVGAAAAAAAAQVAGLSDDEVEALLIEQLGNL